jgi:hypothetical protein
MVKIIIFLLFFFNQIILPSQKTKQENNSTLESLSNTLNYLMLLSENTKLQKEELTKKNEINKDENFELKIKNFIYNKNLVDKFIRKLSDDLTIENNGKNNELLKPQTKSDDSEIKKKDENQKEKQSILTQEENLFLLKNQTKKKEKIIKEGAWFFFNCCTKRKKEQSSPKEIQENDEDQEAISPLYSSKTIISLNDSQCGLKKNKKNVKQKELRGDCVQFGIKTKETFEIEKEKFKQNNQKN